MHPHFARIEHVKPATGRRIEIELVTSTGMPFPFTLEVATAKELALEIAAAVRQPVNAEPSTT